MPPEALSEIEAGLDAEEVADATRLERLRPEWSALWLRCEDATPFQLPEWALPWWRHFGKGELCALSLRDEGRMVGFAPLFIYTDERSGRRFVLLTGTGNTDYLDALFEPGYEAACAGAVFEYLEARSGSWDECDFQQLRRGSALLNCAPPSGWQEEVTPQDVCPALPLAQEDGEPLRFVPHDMLANLRYYRRRAERLGPLSFETADERGLADAFETLVALHRARWRERGTGGVLDDAVINFHREVLPGLLAARALRLHTLRLGGRAVAALYGLRDRRRAYYYIGGFDPEFGHVGPGTLVVGHAVEEAAREGAAEFDFLRGGESYKYRWGARDRVNYRRRLRRRG